MVADLLLRVTPRASGLANPAAWFKEAVGSHRVASGITVNESTALTYSAVYAAVSLLSASVAQLPFIVYRRLPGGGKERATDHPAYRLLKRAPNPMMTSFTWREGGMGWALTWGNSFNEITHDGSGNPTEIWPINNDRVRIRIEGGELFYEIRKADNTLTFLRAEDVLHVPNFGDGINGHSPIRLHREAIGLGLATEKTGASFFGNGMHPGGVFEIPGSMKDEATAAFRKSMKEGGFSGSGGTGKFLILEEGVKWHSVGIPPEDAQFLETRQFQVNEIARIYRVPPHMIGDLSRSTFSNIEQQSLDFVKHSLMHWLVRWQQECNRKLLREDEQDEYFCEFLVDWFAIADLITRYAAYKIGRDGGWLNSNEIRDRENMNPIDGGDTFVEPMNMRPLGGGEAVAQLESPLAEVMEDARRRVRRKEAKAIEAALKRKPERFAEWADKFYGDYEREIAEVMRPAVALAVAYNGGNETPQAMAARYVSHHRGQLLGLARETSAEKLADAVAARVAEWGNDNGW